jgi:glycosyltransferase involved in cell wall biosynthesis
MERFLLTRSFSHILFLSDYSREVGLSLGVPAGRAGVSMPGVDLPAYRADLQKKEDRVLYVGQLHARKGIHDILATARALPSVRFRLFGWSSVRVDWHRMAPRNVEIIPFERGQKLREEFAKARIFFFPTRAETFGLALLEAMVSGCAVVSTLPLNYEGATVQAGDQSAMIAAVKRLWDDRNASLRMGQRNRELADTFTWDNYTNSVLETYSRVLETRPV